MRLNVESESDSEAEFGVPALCEPWAAHLADVALLVASCVGRKVEKVLGLVI
jgi:hypothetical protein